MAVKPRRFLKGVTNVAATYPMGRMPILDPTKYSLFYEDFFRPIGLAASVANGTTSWDAITVRTDNAGAVCSMATDADANGVFKVALNTTDNIYGMAQSANNGSLGHRTGKKHFMSVKFCIDITAGTVNNQELFLGLVDDTDTAWTDVFTAAGTGLTNCNYLAFVMLDGGASIYHASTDDNTGTITDTTIDLVNGAWYELAHYYDGTKFELFCNGASLGKYTPTGIPKTNNMCMMLGMKNGEAKARNLLVDYFLVAQER